LHTDDPSAIEALFSWKSSQYQRTGTFDFFSLPWVRRLLQELNTQDSTEFGAIVSALYFGEQVIAVHFGMRYRNVLASWFPAYDPAYLRFSPGLILLTRLLEALPEEGISRVDLGRGDERYKQSFLTERFDVVEGAVDSRVFRRAMRRSWVAVRQWAETTSAAQRPLRLIRGARQFIARQEDGAEAEQGS
jgi:CelD/BcsL family acetyltransferase involved in cellulose biosynthesis